MFERLRCRAIISQMYTFYTFIHNTHVAYGKRCSFTHTRKVWPQKWQILLSKIFLTNSTLSQIIFKRNSFFSFNKKLRQQQQQENLNQIHYYLMAFAHHTFDTFDDYIVYLCLWLINVIQKS